MTYYIEDQIVENNKVQQAVPKELLKKFFDNGIDLWYFIDDYEECTDDDLEDDEIPFPMSCKGHSQADTWDDIDERKTYYAQTEDFLEYADGDGIEYEVWIHIVTKDEYRVPTHIVRDFSNATKIG